MVKKKFFDKYDKKAYHWVETKKKEKVKIYFTSPEFGFEFSDRFYNKYEDVFFELLFS